MRKLISWVHFLACIGWTLFLVYIAIERGREMFDGGGVIATIALLVTTGTGIYLFAIGANRQFSQLEKIKTENKILQVKLEQANLQQKLSEMGKKRSEQEIDTQILQPPDRDAPVISEVRRRSYLTQRGTPMELEITWRRSSRVWWSFLWRNLIAIAVATIICGILGLIIGFFMAAMGFKALAIQSVAVPLGIMIGLGISIVPIKMILGKDFGEFRLVLLAKQTSTATPDANS